MRQVLSAALVVGLFVAPLGAGKYNPQLNPGDPAPGWEKLPGTDGAEHASAELKDKDVLVIAFTCNSCPTAVDYEDRLIALAKDLAGRNGAVVAVSSNDASRATEDALPGMRAKAEAKKFPFLYLRDDGQKLAKAFGATFTPEFFVLNKDRKVVYMGALDDNTDVSAVKLKYVEEAVAAALAGKTPAVQETVARGCAVRYERVRRTKN